MPTCSGGKKKTHYPHDIEEHKQNSSNNPCVSRRSHSKLLTVCHPSGIVEKTIEELVRLKKIRKGRHAECLVQTNP